MPRFYTRLMVISLIVFNVALLLLHAQTYDDHELRGLLLPEGCPAPCFMGIRPGVTTVEEAIGVITASGWVEPNPRIDEDSSQIDFTWNGHQPAFIMGDQTLTLAFSSGLRQITQISFRTQANISVGDVYLSLGVPSSYSYPSIRLLNLGDTRYSVILFHQYERTAINLITFTNCPVKMGRLLNQPLNGIRYNFFPQTGPFTISLKQLLRSENCNGG